MDPDVYLCHQCGKIFYKLSTLESHTKWKHMEKTNEFMCDQCGRTFQKKYNLLKHLESGVHDVSETVKCAVCDFRALNRKIMGEHYQRFHGILLKESNVYFKTADEFYSWKNDFENNTRSRFVKMSSSRKRKNGFIRSTYFCHRDGNFIPKGRNLRHLKMKGSNKINAHCPAKMDVDIGERIVIVSYIDTHLGHELDISRMNLDPVDKALIAKKLALQVPFEKILDEINSSAHHQQNDLKRLNLLTRKDLWNIVDAFKINPKTVVYNKNKVGRRKKLERPKKEPKRNRVYLKIYNQDSQQNGGENRVVYDGTGEAEYTDGRVLAGKQAEEENVIFCPMVVKEESEYIQEYTVISDELDGENGTCFIINAQGELETVSGHRVIYTDDGNMEICDVQGAIEDENDESSQTTLNDGEETNSLLEQVGYSRDQESHELTIPDIKQEVGLGSSADSGAIDSNEEYFIKSSINKNPTEITTVTKIKQETEECSDVLYVEKYEKEGDDPPQYFVEEISMGDDPEYEVTIANDAEEEVNEYVIITTTEEELNDPTSTVISTERDVQHDFDKNDSLVLPLESIVNQKDVMVEPFIKEEVVSSMMEESGGTSEVGKPKWCDKRKEALNMVLNVHNMINNERQLQVFSKNITSLENVLKALSKNGE